MKLILVPTDFSAPADHAVEAAAQLAQKQGATVHLIHSVDVPDTWQDARFSNAVLATKPLKQQQDLYPEIRARVGEARQMLDNRSQRIARKKVKVTYHVAANVAWQDITTIARDLKADLIIMGTHGAGAMKEALMGSNTQRVVRLADVPVLTLRDALPKRIANVALLLDPLEPGLEKTIHGLLRPLEGQRTRLHLVRVNTPNGFQDTDTSLEQLHKLVRKLEPTCLVHVCDHYSVAEGAVAFARREGMDLIALPTHGRQGLRAMLNASVAETIVNHSPVPVLTMKA
ncbi:MAG: universal stress protein [Flavobacteriales bacterium]